MRAKHLRSGQSIAGSLTGIAMATVVLIVAMVSLPVAATADGNSWRGEYYNNTNLSGTPALVREDADVSFSWGSGSPGSGVNADRFSVRWTRFVSFSSGTYTFFAEADDGVRLWVDDQLLIDQWHDAAATTYRAAKSLSSGYHSVRVEYYDNGGIASIRLWWASGGATAGEWRGEYFANTTLSGSPVVRNDAAISFDWGTGAPIGGVGSDNFSVRWTRQVGFATGSNYTFSATVDDGVRLWVDGTLVLDKWYPQSRTTHSVAVYLSAGNHEVKVEYFEAGGNAVCVVNWAASGGGSATEVVVDDVSGRFVRGGTGTWYARSVGYRGHLFWAWNTQSTVRNWAKWYPYVPSAGNWEVYVYVAGRYFGSKSARYSVYHNGVRHDRTVIQNNYNDKWVSLGTFYFSGGSGEYVYLGGNTGEATATRFVGFDAVRFVLRDGAAPPVTTCSIVPILGFGRIWNGYSSVRSKLGCASETEKNLWMGEQTFQGGSMFWRQDNKKVYVLYTNGTWQTYSDTWSSQEPEWDPSLTPPAGLYQPKRGFGKVWRENAAVRNGLGWGTIEERGFNGSKQDFQNGLMLWSSARGIFVLYNDGRWEHHK